MPDIKVSLSVIPPQGIGSAACATARNNLNQAGEHEPCVWGPFYLINKRKKLAKMAIFIVKLRLPDGLGNKDKGPI